MHFAARFSSNEALYIRTMEQMGTSRMALLFLLAVPSFTIAQGGDEPVAPEPDRIRPSEVTIEGERDEPMHMGSPAQEGDQVLTIVEQMPEFPGGPEKMFAYFAKYSRYPEDAKEAGVQGKVYLSFVVEKDGSISNVNVIRGVYPSLDQEAIRVVKTMPKWNPGKQNGRVCRTAYNLPFAFVLAK